MHNDNFRQESQRETRRSLDATRRGRFSTVLWASLCDLFNKIFRNDAWVISRLTSEYERCTEPQRRDRLEGELLVMQDVSELHQSARNGRFSVVFFGNFLPYALWAIAIVVVIAGIILWIYAGAKS